MDCKFSSPGANKVRVAAVVGLLFGVIQLGFAATAAGVLSEDVVGAWWVGFIVLITVIFTGMKATNQCCLISGIILSVVCIIVAIIGAIIDGAVSAHFASLDTCVGQNGDIYGDPSQAYLATTCRSSYPRYSCVCIDGYTCYGYKLNSGYECDVLLEELPDNLGMSALFAVILCIVMIVYSCITCGVTCCTASCGEYNPSKVGGAGGAGSVAPQSQQPPPVQNGQQPLQQQPVQNGQPVVQMVQPGQVAQQGAPVVYQQGAPVVYQAAPVAQGQPVIVQSYPQQDVKQLPS